MNAAVQLIRPVTFFPRYVSLMCRQSGPTFKSPISARATKGKFKISLVWN